MTKTMTETEYTDHESDSFIASELSPAKPATKPRKPAVVPAVVPNTSVIVAKNPKVAAKLKGGITVAQGAADVMLTVDYLIAVDKIADESTLERLYGVGGKTGSLAIAKAWMDLTGQKLTKLGTKADEPAYRKLRLLGSVIARFGAERPARLSSWSAICKATTLTDAQLDSLVGETIDQEAVQSLKPAGVAKAAAKAKLKSQELTTSPEAEELDWNSAEAQAQLTGTINAFVIALRDPRVSVHADGAKAMKNAIGLLAQAIK